MKLIQKDRSFIKLILDSSLSKIICFLLITVVISGCSVTLKHHSLDVPSQQFSDQIGASSKTRAFSTHVGYGRFTVFSIPVIAVHIVGDGRMNVMELICDALKQVGYNVNEVLSGMQSEVPIITCKVEKFWFNNYTWFFPFVPTWGRIQLETKLISPEGEVLWSRKFTGKGFTANFFNGYTSAANKSIKKILNGMVKEFSGEEFHSILVNYSLESQDKKSIESLEDLEKELKNLEEMKAKQLITEEEYLDLKKKMMDKY